MQIIHLYIDIFAQCSREGFALMEQTTKVWRWKAYIQIIKYNCCECLDLFIWSDRFELQMLN